MVRLWRSDLKDCPWLAPGLLLAPYVMGASLILGNLRCRALLLW